MKIDGDDRIAQGKNLLRKFQSKQRGAHSSATFCNSDVDRLSINSTSNAGFSRNEDSCNESSAFPEGSTSSRESSRPPSFCNHRIDKNEICSSQNEISELHKIVEHKQEALDKSMEKLNSLHKHYSELHKAYTHLCDNKNDGNIVSDDFGTQIKQLHVALGIAINEKTSLQSELRGLQFQIHTLKEEYRSLEDSVKEWRSKFLDNSNKLENQEQENYRFLETIKNQNHQIEKCYKDCSELQAKVLILQQDKVDVQARFKHVSEEKGKLENEIKTLKNDAMMKDIYIKQLFNSSSGNQSCHEISDQLRILNDTVDELKNKEVENKKVINDLNCRINEEKLRHEKIIAEQHQSISFANFEINNLRGLKRELESSKNFLQEELKVLRVKFSGIQTKNSNFTQNELVEEDMRKSSIDCAEVERLRNTMKYFENQCSQYSANMDGLKNHLEEKNNRIEELQLCLAVSKQKISEFEQLRNTDLTMNDNYVSISEQLQNEKATVSRALAQNQQLKAQLIELQDRIVQITNESASKEDERVSALMSVKRLKKQIEDMNIFDDNKVNANTFNTANNDEINNVFENGESCVQCNETLHNTADSELHGQYINYEYETKLKNISSIVDDLSTSSKHIEKVELAEIATENLTPVTIVQQPNRRESTDLKKAQGDHDKVDCSAISNAAEHSQKSEFSDMKKLLERLEGLAEENKQWRMSNDRLQYWLTMLESENESIGEYIALYRFQRTKIQKQLCEKERSLNCLEQTNFTILNQLTQLKQAAQNFLDLNSTSKTVKIEADCKNHKLPEQSQDFGGIVKMVDIEQISDVSFSLSFQQLVNEIEKCDAVLQSSKREYKVALEHEDVIQCLGCTECKGGIKTL